MDDLGHGAVGVAVEDPAVRFMGAHHAGVHRLAGGHDFQTAVGFFRHAEKGRGKPHVDAAVRGDFAAGVDAASEGLLGGFP